MVDPIDAVVVGIAVEDRRAQDQVDQILVVDHGEEIRRDRAAGGRERSLAEGAFQERADRGQAGRVPEQLALETDALGVVHIRVVDVLVVIAHAELGEQHARKLQLPAELSGIAVGIAFEAGVVGLQIVELDQIAAAHEGAVLFIDIVIDPGQRAQIQVVAVVVVDQAVERRRVVEVEGRAIHADPSGQQG